MPNKIIAPRHPWSRRRGRESLLTAWPVAVSLPEDVLHLVENTWIGNVHLSHSQAVTEAVIWYHQERLRSDEREKRSSTK